MRHAQTLWACDFFSQKVLTAKRFVEIFVLFFIHVGSRRVHIAGMTAHPDRAWMMQQARNILMFFGEQKHTPTHLLRDHDGKFVPEFDAVFESDGVKVTPISVRAPNMNATAERWVQSVRVECLDHFVVFGERHLRHLLAEYLAYYHEERPHQSLGNVPLSGKPPPAEADILSLADIVCQERLGGLLKNYSPSAA